ncbi:hypothetical protein EBQ93_04495 [bacterium]|nr:hypothetical protein [bacterium]
MKKNMCFTFILLYFFTAHGAISKIYSSMRHDLRSVLLGLIEQERAAILAAQFLITDDAFVHAIRSAVDRGVNVEMIVDKACFSKWGKGQALQQVGVLLHVYDAPDMGIMHKKAWVFAQNVSVHPDKPLKIVAHGSYNPTLSALKKTLKCCMFYHDQNL